MLIEPIFDEWMESGATFTTSVGFAEMMGRADQLGLQLNVPVGPTLPTSATVTMFMSQDGFDFFPLKVGTGGGATPVPQISGSGFTANKLNVFTWGEPWPTPPKMKYVQFQVFYQGPGMRLTLYATFRERRVRQRSYEEPCDGCAEAAEPPAYMRALHTMAPDELASLRALALDRRRSGGSTGRLDARARKKFDAALNAAVLQMLAGSE